MAGRTRKTTAPKEWTPWTGFSEPRNGTAQAAVDKLMEQTALALAENMTTNGLSRREQEQVLLMAAALCGFRLQAVPCAGTDGEAGNMMMFQMEREEVMGWERN